jgi:hypothetical protein
MIFDQTVRLEVPSDDSSFLAKKKFWDAVKLHATDKQIQDLSDRGIRIPHGTVPGVAVAEKNFHPGIDGMSSWGADSKSSGDFASEFGPARAQAEYEATQKAIAARAAEAARLAAEQRAVETARNAASRDAFRAYHFSLTDPRQKDTWRNIASPAELMLQYAVARNYVDATACGFPDQATLDKVRAELNDPRYMSAWGRDLK